MATAVLTRSYDNGRTGANLTETILTPDLVQHKKLKRVRSFVLQDDDPRIEAQPLYVPQLTMPDGHKHNVLFVEREESEVIRAGEERILRVARSSGHDVVAADQ